MLQQRHMTHAVYDPAAVLRHNHGVSELNHVCTHVPLQACRVVESGQQSDVPMQNATARQTLPLHHPDPASLEVNIGCGCNYPHAMWNMICSPPPPVLSLQSLTSPFNKQLLNLRPIWHVAKAVN
eukprot:360667-Chlamydomonas_euryale.AAC.13